MSDDLSLYATTTNLLLIPPSNHRPLQIRLRFVVQGHMINTTSTTTQTHAPLDPHDLVCSEGLELTGR